MKRMLIGLILISTLLWAAPVPDFKLSDFKKNPVSLSSLIKDNRYTVVGMFTVSCPYCNREMADFSPLSRKYGHQRVGFVGVFLDENINGAKDLVKENAASYPVLMGEQAMVEYFQLRGVPFTFIVDSKGTVVYKVPGYMPLNDFDDMLKALLAKK
jgi:thioredoxin-related protein